WNYIVHVSPAIEAAFLLDDQLDLLPSGYVNKRKDAAVAFKALFMNRILPDLRPQLNDLDLDMHRHLHKEYEGPSGRRGYLISVIKKSYNDHDYYVVLKISLDYVVNNLFPEVLNPLLVSGKVSFCVRDERDRILYGEAIGQPGKFLYEKRFTTTLWRWRLQ